MPSKGQYPTLREAKYLAMTPPRDIAGPEAISACQSANRSDAVLLCYDRELGGGAIEVSKPRFACISCAEVRTAGGSSAGRRRKQYTANSLGGTSGPTSRSSQLALALGLTCKSLCLRALAKTCFLTTRAINLYTL